MAITLPNAYNRSVYKVSGTFTDDEGSAVTPTTVKYSLLDEFGNIVNSREQVSITPGTTYEVFLYGDDTDRELSETRYFNLYLTYSDSEGHTGLPLNVQGTFSIIDWVSEEST